MSRLHYAFALSFIVAGTVDVSGVQAASLRVGDAVQIVHDVESRRSNEQPWDSKGEGDHVYESEFIRTAVESQARLLLIDRTGLSVGPITTIRIDRVLYNSDQSVKSVVVSAGAGTVRWTSGDSNSYLIRTPTANVTPIGTVFDLFVDSQRTFVILRQGRVKVCTTSLQPACKNLDNPGEMILATADELRGPGRGGLSPSDFADRCLSAAGADCTMNLTPSPQRDKAPERDPPAPKKKRADYVPPSRPRQAAERPRPTRVVVEQPSRDIGGEAVAAGVLSAFALGLGSSVMHPPVGHSTSPYRPTGGGNGHYVRPNPGTTGPRPGTGLINGPASNTGSSASFIPGLH
jgi:FecR protein